MKSVRTDAANSAAVARTKSVNLAARLKSAGVHKADCIGTISNASAEARNYLKVPIAARKKRHDPKDQQDRGGR